MSLMAPCLYPECTNPDLHVSRNFDFPITTIATSLLLDMPLKGVSGFGIIVFGKLMRSVLVHLGNMYSGKRRSVYLTKHSLLTPYDYDIERMVIPITTQ